jgi:putative peptidoglycan lipid II flippase
MTTTSGTSPSVARSSLLMASGSVVSRLLGVVRQSLIVLAIGQGLVGNAFQTANTLPNVIYMIIAGGVLNSILVPQLVKAATNPDGGREYTDRIITLASAGFLLITVACTAGAGLLIRLYSQNLAADALWLATFFAVVTIPQIFFYGLYALLGQVLNARGQFAAFGWSPALANVVSIAGLLAFMRLYDGHLGPDRWSPTMVVVLAGTATLSVVVQALFLIIPLWRSGFRWTPRFGVRGVGLRTTSRIAGWAFAALVVSQLGYLVASNVMWHASNQSDAVDRFVPGVAVYSNALFVFMVPHAFVAVSIITALYPRMSRAAGDGDLDTVRTEYERGITVPATVTVPASVALILFCVPITEILFTSRDPAELPATALTLAAMAIGVVPFGIDVLNQRFFYMYENGRLALAEQLVLSISATAITLSTLLLPPWYAVPVIGVGIVVSNVLASLFGMSRVRRLVGHLPVARIWWSQARMLLASAVAALPGFGLFVVLRRAVEGRLGVLIALAVAGVVYGLVYLVMARVLRISEVGRMLDQLHRRLPGRRPPGRHEG